MNELCACGMKENVKLGGYAVQARALQDGKQMCINEMQVVNSKHHIV